MKIDKRAIKTKEILLAAGIVLLAAAVFFIFHKARETKMSMDLAAPGKEWNSPKKVEDYFVERLRMTPKEAGEIRGKEGTNGTVDLRINEKVTLDALISNLQYYGFVKDEKAFLYALTHTKDTTPSDNAIQVDAGRSIDRNAEYRISEDMDSWKIADILLNRPSGHFSFDEYGYFFMP